MRFLREQKKIAKIKKNEKARIIDSTSEGGKLFFHQSCEGTSDPLTREKAKAEH